MWPLSSKTIQIDVPNLNMITGTCMLNTSRSGTHQLQTSHIGTLGTDTGGAEAPPGV